MANSNATVAMLHGQGQDKQMNFIPVETPQFISGCTQEMDSSVK